jgi:hypothetical protein
MWKVKGWKRTPGFHHQYRYKFLAKGTTGSFQERLIKSQYLLKGFRSTTTFHDGFFPLFTLSLLQHAHVLVDSRQVCSMAYFLKSSHLLLFVNCFLFISCCFVRIIDCCGQGLSMHRTSGTAIGC